ncbi:hypothetical protein MKZ02_00245 [Pseudobacillus sp. FSL P4-0506]|uniref:hypothetical protein n=1 Tax=unclassified Pseudobacillus TaxID=2619284 RepID=UPI0030F6E0B2
MMKTAKADFVDGFIPKHTYGLVDDTSVEGGHVYYCKVDGQRHRVRGVDQPNAGNKGIS